MKLSCLHIIALGLGLAGLLSAQEATITPLSSDAPGMRVCTPSALEDKKPDANEWLNLKTIFPLAVQSLPVDYDHRDDTFSTSVKDPVTGSIKESTISSNYNRGSDSGLPVFSPGDILIRHDCPDSAPHHTESHYRITGEAPLELCGFSSHPYGRSVTGITDIALYQGKLYLGFAHSWLIRSYSMGQAGRLTRENDFIINPYNLIPSPSGLWVYTCKNYSDTAYRCIAGPRADERSYVERENLPEGLADTMSDWDYDTYFDPFANRTAIVEGNYLFSYHGNTIDVLRIERAGKKLLKCGSLKLDGSITAIASSGTFALATTGKGNLYSIGMVSGIPFVKGTASYAQHKEEERLPQQRISLAAEADKVVFYDVGVNEKALFAFTLSKEGKLSPQGNLDIPAIRVEGLHAIGSGIAMTTVRPGRKSSDEVWVPDSQGIMQQTSLAVPEGYHVRGIANGTAFLEQGEGTPRGTGKKLCILESSTGKELKQKEESLDRAFSEGMPQMTFLGWGDFDGNQALAFFKDKRSGYYLALVDLSSLSIINSIQTMRLDIERLPETILSSGIAFSTCLGMPTLMKNGSPAGGKAISRYSTEKVLGKHQKGLVVRATEVSTNRKIIAALDAEGFRELSTIGSQDPEIISYSCWGESEIGTIKYGSTSYPFFRKKAGDPLCRIGLTVKDIGTAGDCLWMRLEPSTFEGEEIIASFRKK